MRIQCQWWVDTCSPSHLYKITTPNARICVREFHWNLVVMACIMRAYEFKMAISHSLQFGSALRCGLKRVFVCIAIRKRFVWLEVLVPIAKALKVNVW
jgi:hypothetical protein